MVIDDDELDNYVKSDYNTIKLSTWKNNLTRIHQHIHFLEKAQSALDYMFAVISATMGGTATRDYTYLV